MYATHPILEASLANAIEKKLALEKMGFLDITVSISDRGSLIFWGRLPDAPKKKYRHTKSSGRKAT